MPERVRWQYCQIEVGANSTGTLKQFVAGREFVETNLHGNWPGMLGKLGEQGWEMVSAFPNEGGRGHSPLTYVFKRPFTRNSGAAVVAPASSTAPSPEDDPGPTTDFEPLRGS